jgi:hypothetical protein
MTDVSTALKFVLICISMIALFENTKKVNNKTAIIYWEVVVLYWISNFLSSFNI